MRRNQEQGGDRPGAGGDGPGDAGDARGPRDPGRADPGPGGRPPLERPHPAGDLPRQPNPGRRPGQPRRQVPVVDRPQGRRAQRLGRARRPPRPGPGGDRRPDPPRAELLLGLRQAPPDLPAGQGGQRELPPVLGRPDQGRPGRRSHADRQGPRHGDGHQPDPAPHDPGRPQRSRSAALRRLRARSPHRQADQGPRESEVRRVRRRPRPRGPARRGVDPGRRSARDRAEPGQGQEAPDHRDPVGRRADHRHRGLRSARPQPLHDRQPRPRHRRPVHLRPAHRQARAGRRGPARRRRGRHGPPDPQHARGGQVRLRGSRPGRSSTRRSSATSTPWPRSHRRLRRHLALARRPDTGSSRSCMRRPARRATTSTTAGPTKATAPVHATGPSSRGCRSPRCTRGSSSRATGSTWSAT